MIQAIVEGARPRLCIAAAAATLLVAAVMPATAAAPPAGVLLTFDAPDAEVVRVGPRRVMFGESTKGGMLIMVMDDYLFEVGTAGGGRARVGTSLILTTNLRTPFADESEAEVREEAEDSARQGAGFASAVQIDGVWFEELGYGTSNARKGPDSVLYSGHRHGSAYLITASYLSDDLPTDQLRALMRRMKFGEAPLRAAMSEYAALLGSAVSPSGFVSNYGLLPVAVRKQDELDELYTMRLPGTGTRAGDVQPPADGYYRIGYERRNDGWVAAMCRPDGGRGREAFEQDLLPGEKTSDVRTLSPLQTPSGEVRRFALMRGHSKPSPTLAWTAHRDGVVFHAFASADTPEADVEKLVAAVSDPSRRCVPMPEPPQASSPSSAAAAP